MPTINLGKKPKNYNRKKYGKNAEILKIYSSIKWKKLRDATFMMNPICTLCGEKETKEIHHIIPISTGTTYLEMCGLAYDPNNVRALCAECHELLHKQLRNNKL